MSAICCIIGGVECKYTLPADAFIIAADKGYEYLRKIGKLPHLAVGDFDSLGEIPKDVQTIVHPVEKDDSDTALAVKEGLKRGYRIFLLYGCLGGDRFEHSIANLQLLAFIAHAGGMGFMVDGDTVITAIHNAKLSFDSSESGEISVFCIGQDAENVNISGLKYPLINATLSSFTPLGLSNRFEGRAGFVSVGKGTLLVLWNKQTEALICDLGGALQ